MKIDELSSELVEILRKLSAVVDSVFRRFDAYKQSDTGTRRLVHIRTDKPCRFGEWCAINVSPQ